MHKYQRNQAGTTRRDAAQSRIKDKVAVLAKWEGLGIIPKDLKYLPKSKAAFCRWEDASLQETVVVDGKEKKILGVFSFTEATLDKAYNAIFKERAVDLIVKLNARKTRKGQNSELIELKAQIKELRAAVQNITNEFVESRSRNIELERIVLAQKLEIARLMERLRNIVTLGPKGVI